MKHPDGIGAEAYFESVSVSAERGYLHSDRYRFLVAERDGERLGFIALREFSHVFHLFVCKEHQRQGVARRLWEAARTLAQDAATVRVFTVNSSLRAVPVYASFGFRPAGDVVSRHGVSVVPMRLEIGGHKNL